MHALWLSASMTCWTNPLPSAPRTVTDATIERVVSGSPSHIRLSYATGIEKIMRGFGSNGNGPEETDIP